MANENIKLNFVILCDNAFVAQETNALSIIGIFDRINADRFPAQHGKFVVVTNISSDPGEYNQIIIIKNRETDKEVAKLHGKLFIHRIGQKAQFIGNFMNVVFPQSGEYVIEISINGELQDLTNNFYVERKE